ncbi:U3 snoRNP-associated protein-like YAO isoform X2 [Nymphaea colorata]|uniref:U3 snoRNP-associated protein-like YAO isoform X2 n=1 Tax=Nymphaea colorata TaxID=210225 RepID=UPI00214F5A6E|nr:U3 snoRNP-associated protein-like YAO isoform X2 [Nymphaea colorata]
MVRKEGSMKVRKRSQSSIVNRKQRNPRSRSSFDDDRFFNKRNKRTIAEDEEIRESDYDDDDEFDGKEKREGEEGAQELEPEDVETADEKRVRVAKAYLEKIRAITRHEEEDGYVDEDEDEAKAEEARKGMRDSLVADFLQQEQLEESGRVRRQLALRVQKPVEGFRLLVKHRKAVTAVSLSDDDLKGFSASKDGTIFQWDVESGKTEKYSWPSWDILSSHGARKPESPSIKWSNHVLALAVSSDGRYLATGGLDRHVHLWDVRTREHIQAFPGHRRPVSCLIFRQGTSQLFSGSFDRSIKIWSAEDRSYLGTSHGHEGEILAIDCLRKERTLTVGRDRTMRLSKIPEETHLIFRSSTASLESCCFISNDEFLSGSDDGSIELWSLLKKKPIFVVRHAHSMLAPNTNLNGVCDERKMVNGHSEALESPTTSFLAVGLSMVPHSLVYDLVTYS